MLFNFLKFCIRGSTLMWGQLGCKRYDVERGEMKSPRQSREMLTTFQLSRKRLTFRGGWCSDRLVDPGEWARHILLSRGRAETRAAQRRAAQGRAEPRAAQGRAGQRSAEQAGQSPEQRRAGRGRA